MKLAASAILVVPSVAAMASSLRSQASFQKDVVDPLGLIPGNCATINTCESAVLTACFSNCPKAAGTFGDYQIGGLDLNSSSISGSITTTLGNQLSFAQPLYPGTGTLLLDWNQIAGSLPNSICSISGLKGLSVGENLLTGDIPSCIGRLTDLQILSLWNNAITGSIPESICSLTKLQGLYLDQNSLTGKIPTCITQLTALEDVRLWNNQLTGNIPDNIGALPNLETFIVNHNNLVGTIPSSFGNLDKVTYIALNHNSMTGRLPTSLGSLTGSMAPNTASGFLGGQFYVSENRFTGTIPSSFCSLVGAVRFCSTGNYLNFRDCSACQPLLQAKCRTPCGTPCNFIASTTCLPAVSPDPIAADMDSAAADLTAVTSTLAPLQSVSTTSRTTTTTNSSSPARINEPRCFDDYYCGTPSLECTVQQFPGTSVSYTATANYDLVVLQTYDWPQDIVCSAPNNLASCVDQTVFETVATGDFLNTTYGGPKPPTGFDFTNHQNPITSIIFCNEVNEVVAQEPHKEHPERGYSRFF